MFFLSKKTIEQQLTEILAKSQKLRILVGFIKRLLTLLDMTEYIRHICLKFASAQNHVTQLAVTNEPFICKRTKLIRDGANY